ncbi:DEAD-domain-containing protein [Violaceomyces palustris]|uniref:DEAD-domain-containing protein n=1 Tax=Violaceomyces palustris TaxID=1673888 RepID=A0ACD0P6J2_9BASI|nr:DEAD-domain-containing protein [Violaceomyces palustris]
MAKTIDFLASDEEDDPRGSSLHTSTKRQRSSATKPRGKRARKGDQDSDDDIDITSSLLPSNPSTSSNDSKLKGKAKAKLPISKATTAATNASAVQDEDHDPEDDAAFIAQVMQQQNKKAGAEMAKTITSSKSKGKNKLGSGIVTGGGSFQSMGLHPSLLRSLLLRGFTTPTPIQRQTIPSILAQPPRDLVGMARTGSGKTLAYLIPLIQRLNGRHSRTFGIKSLILCPSRELALQILKIGKEIARGWKADPGEGQDGRGEAIRWAMIVGGEGLDEQFALMANNPDVVVATPGRLLHLTVEMNLDLKAVEYVVFDEADRLFEMGFAAQLEELLLRLPPSRQTLLFSATLPKTLVEFARAGLQANPKLVRLDVDSKISSELRMSFFSVKPAEKEAALLVILRDLIGVPFGEQAEKDEDEEEMYEESDDGEEPRSARGGGRGGKIGSRGRGGGGRKGFARGGKAGVVAGKKRKRPLNGSDHLLPHQTIIFCATKHHVEYLLLLLTTAGYACSHIYSSLDQAARSIQMSRFRRGQTSLLVVTDVAARGIDLPVLEHVINYDFPPQPRIFVHRVGRTARAGRTGWAWSLCTNAELPHLCDLQLFLARPLVSSHTLVNQKDEDAPALDVHGNLVLGTLPRDKLDPETEFITNGIINTSSNTATALPALKQVVVRAQGMYERSQAKASQESHRRAKEMAKAGEASGSMALASSEKPTWALAGSPLEEMAVHDIIKRPKKYGLKPLSNDVAIERAGLGNLVKEVSSTKNDVSKAAEQEAARAALLAKVNAFRPGETIFEIGARGENTPLGVLMKSRRKTMEVKNQRANALERRQKELEGGKAVGDDAQVEDDDDDNDEDPLESHEQLQELSEADEQDILDVFDTTKSGGKKSSSKISPESSDSESDRHDDDDDDESKDPRISSKAKTRVGTTIGKAKSAKKSFRDPNFYLEYEQKDAKTEKGYSIESSAKDSFLQQARNATFDLNGDDSGVLGTQSQAPNSSRWDTKKKKFVKGDGTGSDNKKLIRTESGLKLPASFRSGRFEEWRREQRLDMPKVGELESDLPSHLVSRHVRGGAGGSSNTKFRHNKVQEPKRLDPLHKDYHKKFKSRQTSSQEGGGGGPTPSSSSSRDSAAKRGGGAGRGASTGARARNEIKSAREIQKQRDIMNKRKAKNARAPKRGGGGSGRGGSRGGKTRSSSSRSR